MKRKTTSYRNHLSNRRNFSLLGLQIPVAPNANLVATECISHSFVSQTLGGFKLFIDQFMQTEGTGFTISQMCKQENLGCICSVFQASKVYNLNFPE